MLLIPAVFKGVKRDPLDDRNRYTTHLLNMQMVPATSPVKSLLFVVDVVLVMEYKLAIDMGFVVESGIVKTSYLICNTTTETPPHFISCLTIIHLYQSSNFPRSL